MEIERLTLVLDSAEAAALRRAARAEMRRPREQARYLLRSVLLGDSPEIKSSTNHNPAEASQAGGGVAEHSPR